MATKLCWRRCEKAPQTLTFSSPRGYGPQNYAGAATKKLPRPALFARPRGPGLYQKGGFGHKTMLAPLRKKLPRPALFPAPGGPGPHLFRPPPRLARGAPPAAPRGFNTKTEARARLNAVCAHLRIAPYSPGTSEKYGSLGGWCSRPRQREIHCTG